MDTTQVTQYGNQLRSNKTIKPMHTLTLFFYLSLFFLIGCTTNQHESESETDQNLTITYWGEVNNYGIAFIDKPSYIEIKSDLAINDLKNGGYVLLVRHTKRDSRGSLLKQLDEGNLTQEQASQKLGMLNEAQNLWELDRNGAPGLGASLNSQGLEEAKVFNFVVNKLRIPISEVYASPSHRTKQHALLGFGRSDFTEKIELIYQPMMKIEEKVLFDIELLRLLSEPISGNGNRVLIAHNNTLERLGIRGVPTVTLDQGDTAIVKPSGNNCFKYLGTIELNEWKTLSKKISAASISQPLENE
jgi:hypothetical protein